MAAECKEKDKKDKDGEGCEFGDGRSSFGEGVDFNNDIIVQLKKEDKNTNIVNVKDNEFIVCDIITINK